MIAFSDVRKASQWKIAVKLHKVNFETNKLSQIRVVLFTRRTDTELHFHESPKLRQ